MTGIWLYSSNFLILLAVLFPVHQRLELCDLGHLHLWGLNEIRTHTTGLLNRSSTIIENMKFSTFHYNYKTDFDRKFCCKVMFSKLKVCIDHNLYIFTELYLMVVVFHHPLPYQFFIFVVSRCQWTHFVNFHFYLDLHF